MVFVTAASVVSNLLLEIPIVAEHAGSASERIRHVGVPGTVHSVGDEATVGSDELVEWREHVVGCYRGGSVREGESDRHTTVHCDRKSLARHTNRIVSKVAYRHWRGKLYGGGGRRLHHLQRRVAWREHEQRRVRHVGRDRVPRHRLQHGQPRRGEGSLLVTYRRRQEIAIADGQAGARRDLGRGGHYPGHAAVHPLLLGIGLRVAHELIHPATARLSHQPPRLHPGRALWRDHQNGPFARHPCDAHPARSAYDGRVDNRAVTCEVIERALSAILRVHRLEDHREAPAAHLERRATRICEGEPHAETLSIRGARVVPLERQPMCGTCRA